ncbi:hypothetical protein [Virgibacillus pantothenticus]|uniref:Uncharacterized protein n=1 Tax=Virgibacillus pantothenticus TaxID=1473 RepID=A0A0L0QLD8_VIRPA|nr:hypothetical protein [Virgibacillus pantothenticus]KNE19058.1 hypothetical protein AFK71_10885 [Virgibacillus pantothenticus]MED3739002.1 hypothetical protein [Virgibacillus pantothenticus]QTY15500.1 hypothetical protein KBP50_16650 [Virgibacillus pantothenticus]SIT16741.1 hypothetical protein SAMN05421787_12729 [Virgibacillus pantothenticus]
MTKLLTTGEMIDRLKVGEIAQDKNGATVRRGNHGLETREGRFINCNYLFLSQKWRILPIYASFDEAMKALKDGKTVAYLDDFGNRNPIKKETALGAIKPLVVDFEYLFNADWVILDD